MASGFVADISASIIGFEHDGLLRGLSDLCCEAASPDNVFDLLAEGWSIQALGYMARLSRNESALQPNRRGGLSSRSIKLIEDYICAHLCQEITLQDLARIVGLSKRHFQRAFQDSFGLTPHRYILSLRIENAKKHLSRPGESITEVALESGFGQVEHFSTTFRRFTGLTPSQFRRQHLA